MSKIIHNASALLETLSIGELIAGRDTIYQNLIDEIDANQSLQQQNFKHLTQPLVGLYTDKNQPFSPSTLLTVANVCEKNGEGQVTEAVLNYIYKNAELLNKDSLETLLKCLSVPLNLQVSSLFVDRVLARLNDEIDTSNQSERSKILLKVQLNSDLLKLRREINEDGVGIAGQFSLLQQLIQKAADGSSAIDQMKSRAASELEELFSYKFNQGRYDQALALAEKSTDSAKKLHFLNSIIKGYDVFTKANRKELRFSIAAFESKLGWFLEELIKPQELMQLDECKKLFDYCRNLGLLEMTNTLINRRLELLEKENNFLKRWTGMLSAAEDALLFDRKKARTIVDSLELNIVNAPLGEPELTGEEEKAFLKRLLLVKTATHPEWIETEIARLPDGEMKAQRIVEAVRLMAQTTLLARTRPLPKSWKKSA